MSNEMISDLRWKYDITPIEFKEKVLDMFVVDPKIIVTEVIIKSPNTIRFKGKKRKADIKEYCEENLKDEEISVTVEHWTECLGRYLSLSTCYRGCETYAGDKLIWRKNDNSSFEDIFHHGYSDSRSALTLSSLGHEMFSAFKKHVDQKNMMFGYEFHIKNAEKQIMDLEEEIESHRNEIRKIQKGGENEN
jgi:hypothetical protein